MVPNKAMEDLKSHGEDMREVIARDRRRVFVGSLLMAETSLRSWGWDTAAVAALLIRRMPLDFVRRTERTVLGVRNFEAVEKVIFLGSLKRLHSILSVKRQLCIQVVYSWALA